MSEKLKVGDAIRYLPGDGTYGYEDSCGVDGRVPGTVVGFTAQRVRVRLTMDLGRTKVTAVDRDQLVRG